MLFYHLDTVSCSGSESTLSECQHTLVGDHDCVVRKEEAGALCNGKFIRHTSVPVFKEESLQVSMSAMRLMLDWLMDKHQKMVEFRYV